MVMVIRGQTEDDSLRLRRAPHVSLRYGKTGAMFFIRLRSAYTGFRLLKVSKRVTMPKRERLRSAMQQRCS